MTAARWWGALCAIVLVTGAAGADETLGALHDAPHVKRQRVDANDNVVGLIRSKAGARARVSPRFAARFQSYIDDIEATGARVLFMGGYRKGRCSPASLHPCGKALDVCQLSRGRVDRRCHLPGAAELARIAERHGLFEGGQWCHSDYGHAQVVVTASACHSHRLAKQ